MASVSELFNTWKEGFANKDSSKIADLLTDDFQFVGKTRNMNKQEALDWTAAGGSPTSIDNLEVLFENDDVAVICHDANNPNNNGIVMTFGKKKDGKCSLWRVVRQVV